MKIISGKSRILILILAVFLIQSEAFAQIKPPSAAKITKALKAKIISKDNIKKAVPVKISPSTLNLNKNPKFNHSPQGLLKKIIKPIRFRNNSEKRMYLFMQNLIKDGQLKIDTATVDQILVQLDTISASNRLNNKGFESNKASIDSIIASNKLDKKASKAVIDTIKTQMSAVIEANADNINQEKRLLNDEISKRLKDIRNVKYSFSSNLAAKDSVKTEDSLYYFKSCLNPKIKIIGWHNTGMNDAYKRYNYNYFSAINLNGYELEPNGKLSNPKDIREFEKTDGVIKLAQSNGCDVHLTIHNANSYELTEFLNDPSSRVTFLKDVSNLVRKDNLKGINIYFEYLEESELFVQFITELHRNLKNINPEIELNITLPAIIDDESLTEIAAFNFKKLDQYIDYYLVLTDDILPYEINLAQTYSPLYNSTKHGNRSIESTMGYYCNSDIPVPKLILTVAYTGLEWQVNDFQGTLLLQGPEQKTYSEILNIYANRIADSLTILEGFDPDQSASYYNITRNNTDNLKQIWFEDFRSLYLKYSWTLENGLGGVSIRGLGNDDGYTELWDVLGATLIKIDTTWIAGKPLKVVPKEMKISDYLTVFLSDVKWAVAIRLKYYDSGGDLIRFNRSHLKDSIDHYHDNKIIWESWQPYVPKAETEGQCYLKNSTYCYALFTRWTIYAELLLWCWAISLCIFSILYIISLYFERYKLGSDKVQNTVKIVQVIFSFSGIISFCFWIYLNPRSSIIGAGSDGSNIEILFIFLLLGSVIGWIINSIYHKNKLIMKGLP